MKIILQAAIMLAPFNAAAQDSIISTAPAIAVSSAPAELVVSTPAASVPEPEPQIPLPEYAKDLQDSANNIQALLTERSRLDMKKVDALSKEIARLDEKIREVLGPRILEELAARRKELGDKERIVKAKAALAEMRLAIQNYYSAKGGLFPENLEDLMPKFISAIPVIELPDHEKAMNAVIYSSGPWKGEAQVTDDGGWIYVSASADKGLIAINCSHKDKSGVELFRR